MVGADVRMKKWYVIQAFAGYEEAIKVDIKRRIKESEISEMFGDVLVPSAKTKQLLGGGDELEDEQLFPGYILVEMEATPEAIRLVQSTPRVLRFLGGKIPVSVKQDEIERIIGQIKGEVVVPVKKHKFEAGGEVEISEGAFAGFVGIIDEIDEDNERLTVMVSIFGRMTPVELNFDQIKR